MKARTWRPVHLNSKKTSNRANFCNTWNLQPGASTSCFSIAVSGPLISELGTLFGVSAHLLENFHQ